MKRLQSNGKGKQGAAKVSVGNGKVVVKFADEEEVYTLKKADCPDYIKPGKWFVSLSSDCTEFLGMRPITALAKAKFLHFATQEEDEPPAPIEKQGGTARRKDGTTFSYDPYLAFLPVIQLVQDEYKGMTVPCFMRYLFVDDGEGNVAIKGGGKNADLLESFLMATGVLDKDIPFTDNILPKLQKTILKQQKVFQVMIKDGYVDSFMELDEPEEDELDDDDDASGDAPWDDDEPVEDDADDD